MSQQEMTNERLLTSYQVGALLQMDPGSVANWVKAGRLDAHRTPGGHLRVRVGDLVAFLRAHDMPIPEDLAGAYQRLLIVDDDRRQLRSLERRMKPYRDQVVVELVGNGIDALIQVGAFKPTLIVLDVFMPEVDGLEVCRRMKLRPETRAIDIIVASGHLTAELEEKALSAGAKRALRKPIPMDLLLRDLGLEPQPRRRHT